MTDGEIVRQVAAHVDERADEIVAFLQRVVATPSLWGDVEQLAAMGRILGDYMAERGVEVEYPDSGTAGAPNVLARVGAREGGRNLILNGHFDVYPPSDSWSFDPFSTPIRDGKLYGPGSTDMKGGTTAMVVASTVMAALGIPRNGSVSVLAVPNHFEGGEGTRRALDAGLTGEAAIICEPTDLDICSAQRGILYMDIVIRGTSAHTTYGDVGINAIEKAAPLIQALRSQAFTRPDFDAFGPQKIVNVSLIEGGLRRCLIPERCKMTVDVRFSPSVTAESVLDDVRAILDELSARDPQFSATVEPQESCVRNPRSPMDWIEHPINDVISQAHAGFASAPAKFACHPAWPDTPVFNERGIPAVTYGPGSKHCYWDDEYVRIDEYLQAIKVYATTAAHWFSR